LGFLQRFRKKENKNGVAPYPLGSFLSSLGPNFGSTSPFTSENLHKTTNNACWKMLKIT
jgi:hypothetical protein